MATVIGEDATASDSSGQNIPIGKWRDGVFDCCDLGCGHAHCWLSWCCFPIALGQVMTRLHLDWLGSPITHPSSWSTFQILVVSCILWLAMDNGMYAITVNYNTQGYEPYAYDPYAYDPYAYDPYAYHYTSYDDLTDYDGSANYQNTYHNTGNYQITTVPYWAVFLDGIRRSIGYAYGLYLLIVMIRARSYLRSKYAIPEELCTGCEDCCCSFWCHCCVVAQMARHLNDYEHNEASCCTDTGLHDAEPHII
jgi:Cys-rich protein (TIGR01571 family)